MAGMTIPALSALLRSPNQRERFYFILKKNQAASKPPDYNSKAYPKLERFIIPLQNRLRLHLRDLRVFRKGRQVRQER